MAEVGRKARHGVSKEKTGASVPEGYREWLLRYSERAYSIHEGASRAIYEFVRYDIGGARWLMNQVIQEGLHVPDSVKELIDIYPGEPETRRILREMKAPYEAVKTTGAKADDENYTSPSGPPTYFAEKMTRIDFMALDGEMAFLDRVSPGSVRSRSRGLRVVVQELLKVDDEARRIMKQICDERKWFIPEHICELVTRV